MDKPIIVLDLETTGVNILTDRIVQIAATKTNRDFNDRDTTRKYLTHPALPIPAEATALHGITDEMVKDKPKFSQIAKGFLEYIQGCDICGFNVLDFDIPLLWEELNRAGHVWNTDGVNIFDSCRIFRNKEKRDLAAAVMFYTGHEHTDAHDAGADIIATGNVFANQVVLYDDLNQMSPEELAEYCAGGKRVDLAGKVVLNDAGEPVYSFGKDKGKEVKKNPGFANWMLKSDFPTQTKRVIENILNFK